MIISADCRIDATMSMTLSSRTLNKSGSLHIAQTCLSMPSRHQSWRLLCSPICSASVSLLVEEKRSTFNRDKADKLVKDLKKVFNTGKTKTYEWRMSQLTSMLKMIEENEADIYRALYQDLSKPESEAFISEVAMTTASCKLALKELDQWMKPQKAKTTVTTYPSSAEIVSEPLGIVLVISTWNYPFLLSLDPVIGALAAGNAVVLKPSEIAPASASLLAKLFQEYLDNSAIKVVEGAVDETTALLEQKWDKIFYTGNGRVGRIIMAAAAKHLTPVILELGGKCPVVVDSNTNLEVSAKRIVAGKWGCNNGQTCIAPDYIVTTKDFAPKLIDALKNELVEFFGENPMKSKDMSRLVNLYHFKRLTSLMDEDEVSDKIVVGGQRNEEQLKISPTILLDVAENSQIMQEEIFGPLLPILTVDNVKDSFDKINSRSKPLAAYIFTSDEELKKAFVRDISAGGMLVNDTILHLTVDSLPFGGVGESGMGSYHGKFSFDSFSHKKGVLYRAFTGDSPTRFPPYTPAKLRLLKALISGDIFQVLRSMIGLPKN